LSYGFDEERRRLAGMLPGARIEYRPSDGPDIEIVALVANLDAPIPVLVERGGYELVLDASSGRRRSLRRRGYRLVLVDDS